MSKLNLSKLNITSFITNDNSIDKATINGADSGGVTGGHINCQRLEYPTYQDGCTFVPDTWITRQMNCTKYNCPVIVVSVGTFCYKELKGAY